MSIHYLKQIHIPFNAVLGSHFYGKPIYCLFKKADICNAILDILFNKYDIVFPPALKKGMVRLLKKRHFQRAAACQKGTFSARRKAKDTFLSDLWHAGMAHLSRVIRFNTDVILLCYLLFSIVFRQFPYFKFLFYHRKIRKFLFPHFTLILT